MAEVVRIAVAVSSEDESGPLNKRPRVTDENGAAAAAEDAAPAAPPTAAAAANGAAAEAATSTAPTAAAAIAALNKREHGHHGHLRTHHSVDEPDEGAGGDGNGGRGGGGLQAAAPQDHHQQQQQQQHASRLVSFAEEMEDGGDDGGTDAAAGGAGGAGGGLHGVTVERFRAEQRAAAAAAHRSTGHSFKQQAGAHGGLAAVAAAAAAAAAAGGAATRGLAIVDDDDDDDVGPRGGSSDNEGGGAEGGSGRALLGRLHFGAAAARGLRPYMEDRHCVVASMQLLSNAHDGGATAGAPLPPDGVPRSYAAIFDGHNGAGAAEIAAARLHVLLAAHPALRLHTGELGPPAVARAEEAAVGDALRAAFGRVDEAALAAARREGVRDGATALVVLRLGQVLYAAHAGDSRAVLCRDGAALRLTEDHKPHLPRERARIEDAGGRVDFQRCWRVIVEPRDGRPGSGLAVSRSLGDLDFKEPHKFVECEPDVLRMPLRPATPGSSSGGGGSAALLSGDAFVVLASDGLWDVMSDEDAVDVAQRALAQTRADLSSGGSRPRGCHDGDVEAKAAAEALLNESLRRGTADNVTVVVMLLDWGGSGGENEGPAS